MKRRALLLGVLASGVMSLGAGVLASCSGTGVAPRPKHGVIGFLSPARSNAPAEAIAAFKTSLQDLGYLEGRDVDVEWAFAGDHQQTRVDSVARDLVQRGVNVIVATGGTATRAALRATSSVPVVVAAVTDPIAYGFVTDLTHPGGQVTGLSASVPDLAVSRFDILTRVLADAWPIAVLYNPADVVSLANWRAVGARARSMGLHLGPIEVTDQSDFLLDRITASLDNMQPAAMLVLGEDTLIDFGPNRTTILSWAVRHGVAGMYFWRKWPVEMGLMSYGPSEEDLYRQSAVYADQILRGHSPADLPIAQPATVEFVVNRLMVQALGLTLPDAVSEMVTEWVE